MLSLHRFALVLTLALGAPIALAQSKVETLNLTFTTVDVPGAAITNVLGINTAGDMVGNYSARSSSPSHGFFYTGGTFTLFDYPGADSTIAHGINDSGMISGCAGFGGGTSEVGFLYDGVTFTKVLYPGKIATAVIGINNAGDLAGGAGTTLDVNHGFELVGTKFKNVTPPGTYTLGYPTGLNNLGRVVGWTFGATTSGFAYTGRTFRTLNFPGATMTEAWGINDGGIVVGWYFGCTPSCAAHGFAQMKGKYFSFDYPNALGTFADGVSAS